MSFIWPELLIAVLLVPLGLLAVVAIDRRRRARAAALGSLGLRSAPVSTVARWTPRLTGALVVAGMTVLTLALARPQAVVSLPSSEGTVILTFDVSGSMSADDLEPTRLEVAKTVARTFIDERPEGVVLGLVAFSDSGLAVQVPTTDADALERAIERLAPTLGTSLGEGIIVAMGLIQSVDEGTPAEYYSNRPPEVASEAEPLAPGADEDAAVVLLTDGENTAAPEPPEVAATAADLGIRIHTVGIGTAEGTTLEVEGFSVHTQLDEPMLRFVSEHTAGEFIALDADADETEPIVDTGLVYDTLAQQLVTRDEDIEVTALFAAAGILLLASGVVASLAVTGRMT